MKAVAHIRRLRRGSQAQLMSADDGCQHVIKFQGNPQTTRVLANEYLTGSLARMVGLSVPEPAIIEVNAETIHQFGNSFQLAGTQIPPPAGLHFAHDSSGTKKSMTGFRFHGSEISKTSRSSVAYLPLTSGAQTLTAGKWCFIRSALSGSTERHSLILVTVSTPQNGVSRMHFFAVRMPDKKCTQISNRGTTLNHGFRGLSDVLRQGCRVSPETFRSSGTEGATT